MKTAFMLIICIVSFSSNIHAQDSTKIRKTNPIIYAEVILGYVPKKGTNIELGATVNYQIQKNLFTLRATALVRFLSLDEYDEFGLLYGRRFINTGRSLSYSIGVSRNKFNQYTYTNLTEYTKKHSTFVAVPFEFNIKWFDSEKEPFRILGIFPVGKSVAFGGSEGFKIQGNISKNSYVAFGVVFGFGFHKQY